MVKHQRGTNKGQISNPKVHQSIGTEAPCSPYGDRADREKDRHLDKGITNAHPSFVNHFFFVEWVTMLKVTEYRIN